MDKRKIRAAGIVVLAAVTILFLAVNVRNYDEYQTAVQEKAAKAQELDSAEQRIETVMENVARYEEEKKEFEKYLFKEQDIPAFIDGISLMADQSLVRVVDMRSRQFVQVQVEQPYDNELRKRIQKNKELKKAREEVKPVMTLAALPIDIKVEGTFPALLTFLDGLENFEQLLTIGNISMASTQQYPMLKCEFTLKIYSFKNMKDL
jgi:hypothetical protein